jgi:hypothetical protein
VVADVDENNVVQVITDNGCRCGGEQCSHIAPSPTSPRIPVSEANAPVDSSGSSSQWIDDVPVPGPYTYHIPDIHNQQPTRVYEWVDPELYNMCYHDWRGTAEWTNFTWQEHKAHFL